MFWSIDKLNCTVLLLFVFFHFFHLYHECLLSSQILMRSFQCQSSQSLHFGRTGRVCHPGTIIIHAPCRGQLVFSLHQSNCLQLDFDVPSYSFLRFHHCTRHYFFFNSAILLCSEYLASVGATLAPTRNSERSKPVSCGSVQLRVGLDSDCNSLYTCVSFNVLLFSTWPFRHYLSFRSLWHTFCRLSWKRPWPIMTSW